MTGEWATRLLAQHPRQPDQRSCGASVLVVERALRDEDYARWLTEGTSRFHEESLGTHGRTTRAVSAAGRIQLPWPRALGTPPWAVANELSAVGRARVVRWATRREPLWDAVLTAVTGGTTVPLYVGSRWLPRHVVLVVTGATLGLQCYEPRSGRVLTITRDGFLTSTFRLAGWTTPWCAVLPA